MDPVLDRGTRSKKYTPPAVPKILYLACALNTFAAVFNVYALGNTCMAYLEIGNADQLLTIPLSVSAIVLNIALAMRMMNQISDHLDVNRAMCEMNDYVDSILVDGRGVSREEAKRALELMNEANNKMSEFIKRYM